MKDDLEMDQLSLVASEEAEQIQKVSDALTMAAEEVKALFERAHEAYQSGEQTAIKGVKESIDELVVKLESDAASLKESYENLTEAVDASEEEDEEDDEPPAKEPEFPEDPTKEDYKIPPEPKKPSKK